ncbi:MAG: hypothetical protein RI953_654 [Pseudomonadota bacterium]|jgi:uncharacterized surface protein with fasciclin (FAS1) repeats
MQKSGRIIFLVVNALFVSLAARAEEKSSATGQAPATSTADIVTTAALAGDFKILLELANFAGLADTLRSAGPFTVFAPTDDAFTNFSEIELGELRKDRELTRRVLLKHVVSGKYDSSILINTYRLPSLLNREIPEAGILGFDITPKDRPVLFFTPGSLRINQYAEVTKADIFDSNGVIHVINRVLQ